MNPTDPNVSSKAPIIKKFFELPLGTRFKYIGGKDVWVSLARHDVGTVARYEPHDGYLAGQSICAFADSEEECRTMEVEVVDDVPNGARDVPPPAKEVDDPYAPRFMGDTRKVGVGLDHVSQPFCGSIVLLETIAEAGALAFYADGTPTPMRETCLKFADELRAKGKQVSQPMPVLVGDVIELCAPDKEGLLVAVSPDSVKAPESWAKAIQHLGRLQRDPR